MARSNGSDPRQPRPDDSSDLAAALAKLPEEFQRKLLDVFELLQLRNPEKTALPPHVPGSIVMSCYPSPIPPTLPKGQIFKRMKAVETGKPIPWTIDFHNGEPPLTIQQPLSWKPPVQTRPAGRPRIQITIEEVQAEESRGLTHQQIAERLTAKLRCQLGPDTKPVKKSLVRARLREADARRRRRSTK